MTSSSMRRSADDLRDRLDLSRGDIAAKQSAFWIMLVLAGVIAAAGVVVDSTATVIGAMIIAPLSIPIFGVAFGVVTQEASMVGRSLRTVTLGAIAVVAVGIAIAVVVPDKETIAASSQVLARTSPTLGDLLAAIATGLAGSFAVMRKDLGEALPGIAVAISLVPLLVVIGVCLGTGSPFEAVGALVLFLSNVAALIAACTLVLALSGYRQHIAGSRRAYVAVAAFLVAVAIPITINTVVLVLQHRWSGIVEQAADDWVDDAPGAEVESTQWEGRTLVVTIRSPRRLPPIDQLREAVYEQVPSGIKLSVVHNIGSRVD